MSSSTRHLKLRDAESKAASLFSEIEKRQLLRPGINEKELNLEVYNLAQEMYGIKKYWHKRIVRSGKNTLCPYRENPPILQIQPDDIVFFDLGPVFEDWEADFGRTYVLGADPYKLKLKADIEKAWVAGKQYFMEQRDITGAQLFKFMYELAPRYGWTFGGEIAGHLIGEFPHEKIHGEQIQNYIHPENEQRMRDLDQNGKDRDWILEVHFVDLTKEIGGFYEQLLTVS